MKTKIDPTKIWWLIIILLPMISVWASILSETFSGQGYMEAWHDSEKVTDRTVAQDLEAQEAGFA